MSNEEGANNKDGANNKKFKWKVLTPVVLLTFFIIGILCFIVLSLVAIFIAWLILRPTKPAFILQDATAYDFNLTTVVPGIVAPNLNVVTDIQITIVSNNPNSRVGVFYDQLSVFAAYKGQRITTPAPLPESYQGHKDVTVWSPFLSGKFVALAPYLGEELVVDESAGMVMIDVKVDGMIRWKVGRFLSGKYHLHANCPAYLSFGDKYKPNTILVGSTAKYQLMQTCHVDV